jgi:hypothetical protein
MASAYTAACVGPASCLRMSNVDSRHALWWVLPQVLSKECCGRSCNELDMLVGFACAARHSQYFCRVAQPADVQAVASGQRSLVFWLKAYTCGEAGCVRRFCACLALVRCFIVYFTSYVPADDDRWSGTRFGLLH